jgi:phenylacetic acid degradation operon negative regulatory protein
VRGKPLGDLVSEGWDLSDVIEGYTKFVARFTPLLAELREAAEPVGPEQAFVVRSLVIHAYRRVQLHDPQLPVELLPAPWPGAAAYELARELYKLTWEQAEQHILATLRREDPDAPTATAGFYDRFGGLR